MKKLLSGLSPMLILAIGVVLVAVLVAFLGRGFSMNAKTGEIKVDSRQAGDSQPVAETFGRASPIAGEKGASAEASLITDRAAAPAARVASSAARYVTHGDASPIAVGPDSQASATLKSQ